MLLLDQLPYLHTQASVSQRSERSTYKSLRATRHLRGTARNTWEEGRGVDIGGVFDLCVEIRNLRHDGVIMLGLKAPLNSYKEGMAPSNL